MHYIPIRSAVKRGCIAKSALASQKRWRESDLADVAKNP